MILSSTSIALGFSSETPSWSQSWSSGCAAPPLSQDLLAPIGSSTPIRQTSCADSESSGIGSALNLSLADPAAEPLARSNGNSAHLHRFLSWPLGSLPSNEAVPGTYSRKVFVGGLPPDIDEGTHEQSLSHNLLECIAGRLWHLWHSVLSLNNIFVLYVYCVLRAAEEIIEAFSRFGRVSVDWPHKNESSSHFPPKGAPSRPESESQCLAAFCFPPTPAPTPNTLAACK